MVSLFCRQSLLISNVQAMYILSTAVFGLPMCKELRRKIQAARIESVMKVE
jgi:hypothetical protein